jgi:hypothetical protein
MRKIARLENGTKAILDTDTDSCLYADQRGLDPAHRQGIDLYMHLTKGGRRIFYKYVWSLYQNDVDYIEVISEEEARKILESKSQWMTKEDEEKVKQVFKDFFEETA